MEVKRAIPRDAEPDQREKNTKMFLGGLNRNTTEDTIKRYFEQNFDCVVDSVDLIYEKRDQLQPGQEPKPRYFEIMFNVHVDYLGFLSPWYSSKLFIGIVRSTN